MADGSAVTDVIGVTALIVNTLVETVAAAHGLLGFAVNFNVTEPAVISAPLG